MMSMILVLTACSPKTLPSDKVDEQSNVQHDLYIEDAC